MKNYKVEFFYHIFFCFFWFSCTPNDKQNTIEGKITNFKASKIYLTEAHYWTSFLDSTTVNNGEFKLNYSGMGEDRFFMASLCYIDSTGKIRKLKYRNHILSSDSARYAIDAFIVDSNNVKISGDLSSSEFCEINSYSSNDAFYITQMMNFGYLENEPSKRSNQLRQYIEIIDKYPKSKYLLSQINDNKSVINRNELKLMLGYFDSSINEFRIAKSLFQYLSEKNDFPVFVNHSIITQDGGLKKMFDSTAKINMVVFWASWCAPCRTEIPLLKKLYKEYKNQGLRIVSVSIDDKKDAWLQALKEEGMPWEQLIVQEDLKKLLTQEFEVSAIPYVLFVSSSGKLISRAIGVDGNSASTYKEAIEKSLKK